MSKPSSPAGRRYGWQRDLPDHRDVPFRTTLTAAALPSKVDLRTRFDVPCYDQGPLGSCTANAVGGAVHFVRRQANLQPDFVPSRLFIYLMERMLEGTRLEDAGATIRDGIKVVAKHGVCPERSQPPAPHDWPYEPARFTEAPPDAAFKFGRDHQAIKYERIGQSLYPLRACLAGGFPIAFGFTVYESFESEEVRRTGIVPLPTLNEQFLGGHAVLAMGYDDAKRMFLVRNSWGPDWGLGGYFLMPYSFMVHPQLAADFWTVKLMEA